MFVLVSTVFYPYRQSWYLFAEGKIFFSKIDGVYLRKGRTCAYD